ncbi:MAG: glycosyltransferase family 39 protein [Anaerolineales bacterium]|nr:glycosyltransferase family 39 protein [Anaerolineales bacterium]
MTERRANLLGIAFAAAAVVLSAFLSWIVFERIPHLEDEFALLWQAEVMADGAISLPSPEFPDSFKIPFVIDLDGQRFGKYPPGWPAALSLGARVQAVWLVQALLSGFSVWMVYLLGRKLAGRANGVIAAALMLLSPLFLIQSGSLLSHMFSLFLSTAFLCAWVDLFARDDEANVPAWMLVCTAGSSLGLLALTRPWTALAVGCPVLFHGLLLLWSGDRRVRLQVLVVGLISAGISSLLFIWQAALTGDPFQDAYSLWWVYDQLGFGFGVGPTPEGHSIAQALINTRFSLLIGIHDLFGWPYLSWIFLPAGAWGLRRNRGAVLTMLIFPSLIVFYLGYWTGAWLFGPRYYFEALPALAIASSEGILWVLRKAGEARRPVYIRSVLAFVVAALVTGNVLYYLPTRLDGFQGLYGINRANLARFADSGLEPGLIIVHSPRWMPYANVALLGYPFSDRELYVAINQGSDVDAAISSKYAQAGLQVFEYYIDQPGVLYQIADE